MKAKLTKYQALFKELYLYESLNLFEHLRLIFLIFKMVIMMFDL